MDMKLVALKDLKPSSFNSRKTRDEAKMKELIASVEEKGILNPILVRPVSSKPGMYEIVCGERRFHAAVAAGLEEIPAVIRTLTDQQALECMVIENLQREDVHPLEEAEGYEALLKKHGYKSVDDIAAKVGKSKAYIYGRMKLCELIPENRKFFYEGKLSPSIALLVARVPAHLQKEVGIKVAQGEWRENGPMSLKEAREYIHEHFMLQLKEAQFDPKEKGLAGKASCAECLKRTGNQKELFDDVKGADICTDPGCFEAKKQAHTQRAITKLKQQGKEVVPQDEAKKLFEYENDESPSHKYKGLDEENYLGGKYRKLREVAKATKDLKIIYAVQPFSGKIIEMVDRNDLPKIMKNAGIKGEGSAPVKNIAKAKTDNRVKEAKRSFYIATIQGHMDSRTKDVLALSMMLGDLRNSDVEALEEAPDHADIDQIYNLGEMKVKELIALAISCKPKDIWDDENLNFLTAKLGFSMAKDYVITKEYLEACTKDELVKLAKEINISFPGTGEIDTKKSTLVDLIYKAAPKGKVPKELLK